MAWEWLTASVTGAVGLAGIVGTAWGGTTERRHQRAQARDDLVRDRLEALYLDILASSRYEVVSSTPQATVVGEPPGQRTTDDMLLRHSKIEAFASREVAEVYEKLRAECRHASYWSSLATDRVREGLRHQFPDDPIFQFPPEASDMDAGQMRTKALEHHTEAELAYTQLVSLIRRELSFR
ncbi:hypothetical protein [Streptomyces sp. JV180]|uniref:hypothetical protein n=1 Tax=Streptomyces sp. JV180 TaxID=858634 RepID=UPI00168BF98D|nr:hypothetical protein [Streptomyces sp. JV180]MBD3548892.1 hypothetical protein [Streptomyces sp. JV180]